MKNLKKITTIGAVVLTMGLTSAAGFATSNYKTPTEAVAGVSERTVETVNLQRQETKKTYGEIAKDSGKLDEFKKENIEIKKENINAQVKLGTITQEKADAIIKSIEEKQADCDGTGSGRIGEKEGARFASNGLGQGLAHGKNGQERGQRKGQGKGQGGMRLQEGTCYTTVE